MLRHTKNVSQVYLTIATGQVNPSLYVNPHITGLTTALARIRRYHTVTARLQLSLPDEQVIRNAVLLLNFARRSASSGVA